MVDVTLIEDDEIFAEYIALVLQRAGYRVRPYSDLPNEQEIFATRTPQIIVSDIYLPSGNGVSLAMEMKERWPDIKVILISTDTITLRSEEAQVADKILPKPFTAPELLQTVQLALLEPASGSLSEYPNPRTD